MNGFEILKDLPQDYTEIKIAMFDFDGTISTLRQGWESVMESFMVEMICGGNSPQEYVAREVRQYIQDSAGIQTIFQMRWLCEAVKRHGLNPVVFDEWEYKDEYNRRLMEQVETRVRRLMEGKADPEDFLIEGVQDFLKSLYEAGVEIYAASGTDHEDVLREAEALGVKKFFRKMAGAPKRKADCSKEAVLRELINEKGFGQRQILIVGDGKVEISLGSEVGAVTLGVASDEVRREGINPVKRQRLIKAGCHALTGDFKNYKLIMHWLRLAD
ncbi:HAD family hydrolase [Thermosediminibacter litoriperuensis]|uniref:HAD family hydrolase n=1 Tax=Thermosediminibacter litoriperuensis TaxID=291989 RepID=UPI001478DD72|nr:HAD family hydrolase [Thermosediminibacter litoriperuensis]